MALSDVDYQNLILLNVGDDGTVEAQMPALWAKNGGVTPMYLQYLYTWRDAIVMLMGTIWRDVTIRMPTRAQLSMREKWQNLQTMLTMVNSLILEYTIDGASVGEMETTVSIEGIPGYPDPNDPIYRGSVVRGQMRRRYPY